MFRYIILYVIILNFQSCSDYYYAPNSHNIPLFEKEKQTRISITKSGGHEFSGIEIQSARSITENTAIMINCFFVLSDHEPN